MAANFRGMQVPYELHKRAIEVTLALYRVTDFFPRDEVLRRALRESANGVFAGIAEAAFADYVEGVLLGVCGKVETILGYLKIARSLVFVRAVNITVLEREYRALAGMLSDFLDELTPEKGTSVTDSFHAPADGSILEQSVAVKSSSQKSEEKKKDYGEKKPSVSAHVPPSPKIREKLHSVFDKKPEGLTSRQEEILAVLKKATQAKLGDLTPHFSGVSVKTIQRDLQDLLERKIILREGDKKGALYEISGGDI
ncbi:MAG: DeoR family transcriptional regulator [bacterium]|nr:DeoR family transcriptional regulator [bacterium]MDZ4299530.1 DeoR family transcriptional regulator [Candidatus Sungbacteria bacterium]